MNQEELKILLEDAEKTARRNKEIIDKIDSYLEEYESMNRDQFRHIIYNALEEKTE